MGRRGGLERVFTTESVESCSKLTMLVLDCQLLALSTLGAQLSTYAETVDLFRGGQRGGNEATLVDDGSTVNSWY